MKLKILAITLARGGSKSIKNKNIVKIKGKPLIYYTIKELKKCHNLFEDYIVSTDSLHIKRICQKYKVNVPFLRPKKLSRDSSSSASALIHAVKYMEKKKRIKFDYILEAMCTNPLKDASDIANIINIVKKKNPDTCIAVHRVYDQHPSRIKKIVNGRIVNFCINEKLESRRQDLRPKAYIRSGAIYAISRDYLMKTGARYGSKNSIAYILNDQKACNIDTPQDLEYVKAKIK